MSGTLKKSKITLAVCMILIIIAGFVSLGVKSASGDFVVKEVTISPYGSDLSFTMYIPSAAFDTDESGHFLKKYPAVIVNEGFTEDRSCMNNVAIELTRQGFVVALFDMYGHGRSESVDNKGYGNNPDPFTANCALLGADDVRDYLYSQGCNGVQREHNKKLNNGLPILHKVPPKRDYGRYFCIMAEKGGTSHGGLTEKLSLFFHAKKQEVNAYGR